MKYRFLNWLRDCRGIAALEAALVLPFFLIFALFLMEFALQQIGINLIDRWTVQASYIARTATNRTSLNLQGSLESSIPSWLRPGTPTVSARACGSLEVAINDPESCSNNLGTDGQTVRLEVVAQAGSLPWIGGRIFGATRRIVHYYVNEGTL